MTTSRSLDPVLRFGILGCANIARQFARDVAPSTAVRVVVLGKENVLAVRMPYKTSSQESLDHAQLVIDAIGVQSLTLPITDMADGFDQ